MKLSPEQRKGEKLEWTTTSFRLLPPAYFITLNKNGYHSGNDNRFQLLCYVAVVIPLMGPSEKRNECE